MRDNPNESTGQQQQPELTPEDHKAIDGICNDYSDDLYPWVSSGVERGIQYERKRVESLSRWREISKDGLPGEGQNMKWIEFVDMRGKFADFTFEARLIEWSAIVNKPFFNAAFTHWRPIDLPTP